MTDRDASSAEAGEGKAAGWGRRIEFAALYVAAPVVHLAFFDELGLFVPVFTLFAAGVVLLALTPGFAWAELVRVRGLARWAAPTAGFTALAAAVIFALVLALVPDDLFGFPRRAPARWALVMAAYPVASVLGQELLYRVLFFHRYRALFPRAGVAIAVNAAVFALAHAFYQNWVALALTFAGGLIFAWAYRRTGSFALVMILHVIAGWLLFTSGLGGYFYHGAIG